MYSDDVGHIEGIADSATICNRNVCNDVEMTQIPPFSYWTPATASLLGDHNKKWKK